MRTIAVIARKGGPGKTTIAVHLALAAFLRGRKTLLADIDPQRSSIAVLKGRVGPGPEWIESAGPKLFALQVASQRADVDTLVIDTANGEEHELGHAIVLADLSLLVVRPTFLDIAAAVRTSEVLHRLNKLGVIVVNQAPVMRQGLEPPAVRKAMRALALLRVEIAPAIVRFRGAYQHALESGRSVEETSHNQPASEEIERLWTCVETLMSRIPDRRGATGEATRGVGGDGRV
jgi:chromosome partitioning protein